MLLDAAEDITAFRHFPQAHWKKLWSSNAIERLNAAIKQRTRVVGIFPNDAAALRLITTVCVDEHDEWLAAERRYMSQESMELLRNPTATVTPIALATNE
jgi:putative transposase